MRPIVIRGVALGGVYPETEVAFRSRTPLTYVVKVLDVPLKTQAIWFQAFLVVAVVPATEVGVPLAEYSKLKNPEEIAPEIKK